MELIFITGMSGAGKSQAMKAFEDNGYYCIDNMPPSLIPKFVELLNSHSGDINKVALVVDIRGGKFFDDFDKNLADLAKADIKYKIVFLEASDNQLIKRFKETRRNHPLMPRGSIQDGIRLEKKKLARIRDIADFIIDTSSLNLSQFKLEIARYFESCNEEDKLVITLMSFGYKKGIPLEADMVFDLRMLPNPYYVEELRPLTGNDASVQAYVLGFDQSQEYMDIIRVTVDFLIPLVRKEMRKQFVVSVGCTGGQHRSVTFANKLGDHYSRRGMSVNLVHRELKDE